MPVGFQGETFSYSDRAASELFGDNERKGFRTFAGAFRALREGSVSRLVLPIENSTTGSVLQVLDRLVEGSAKIVAEHLVEVRHALLGLPGASVDGIKVVRSHPEALAQSGGWISRYGWQPLPTHDTAGAVRLVAEHGDPTEAALATPESADAHGLEVLLNDVVDRLHNTTRFVVLEPGMPEIAADADKSSVAFETLHRPGALALALTELGLRGANLTRIESRPTETPWKYRFFVDLVHPPGQAGFEAVFDPLPVTMAEVHHLGTYRSEVL
jgi:prephenate dehydratase